MSLLPLAAKPGPFPRGGTCEADIPYKTVGIKVSGPSTRQAAYVSNRMAADRPGICSWPLLGRASGSSGVAITNLPAPGSFTVTLIVVSEPVFTTTTARFWLRAAKTE
jgi:hypothetical protein